MRYLISILLLLPAASRGAATFTSASSQWGQILSFAGVTTYPVTLAAKFKRASNANHAIMAVNSSTTERFTLDLDTTSNLIARSVNSAGSSSTAFTGPGTIHNDVWYHGVAVIYDFNSRAIFLNGAYVATNTGAAVVANIDRVIVGARRTLSATGNFFNGDVVQPAVWNVALTHDEIASLGNTNNPVSPMDIRPQSLVFYTPLTTVGATATFNHLGPSLSWTNAPSSAENPKIQLP